MLMRKEDIQDSLGISLATVNNWIKTSTIPAPDYGDRYSKKTYNTIIQKIKNESIKLNGRANRSQIDTKYITYLGIKDKKRKKVLEQVIERFESSGLSNHQGVIALIITMLKSNNLFIEGSLIYKNVLIWIEEIKCSLDELSLFSDFTIFNSNDDFIGAFYQSIQSISTKSLYGAYYTPSELLTSIKVESNKKIIDPCCGSGGILLKILNKEQNPKHIFARDIDPIALQICTTNLVMFFNNPNMTANISKQDLLFNKENTLFFNSEGEKFDYIITNPPWGSKFSKQQKDLLVALYPEISTTEAFSIALYQAIKMLANEGKLYFFLPHSFLNVSTHRNIRNHILSSKLQIGIKLLGNAFKGVLSEAILLELTNNNANNKAIEVENKAGKCYFLNKENIVSPDWVITATASKRDEAILNKIFNSRHSTLLGNADFALGIVTGNNKKHLLRSKSTKSESIYRGKDITPYKFAEPEYFIKFQPEIYQQVAASKYYRAKKIVYRFISDKIICALDFENKLILNSANLFIPYDYQMETIVCLFNSSIYSFIYRKKFHSTKVLKSHIQNMPLPKYTEADHSKFLFFYKEICNGTISQAEIDFEICKYFGLTTEEYNYIKDDINGRTE
ncbi:MAG TPA: N-6 DNA methylase [Candidatus Paceibacterota bacterium]|nr:N-6 DNA methylase [Candidatus Paceibacterota bacterium]